MRERSGSKFSRGSSEKKRKTTITSSYINDINESTMSMEIVDPEKIENDTYSSDLENGLESDEEIN